MVGLIRRNVSARIDAIQFRTLPLLLIKLKQVDSSKRSIPCSSRSEYRRFLASLVERENKLSYAVLAENHSLSTGCRISTRNTLTSLNAASSAWTSSTSL